MTPLPNAAGFVRIAYKFYFSVNAAQWTQITAALTKSSTISNGQVLCGSTVYLQTAAGKDTQTSLSATSQVCERDS